MKFSRTTLAGLWLIDLELREDERGFLARTYCENEFAANDLNTCWPQCNLTLTEKRGMVRGMHFQADPKPEIKLIRCAAGAIFDVLVDVRRDSPTFGRWEGFELSSANRRMLYVPGGFAHGFQCLMDNCEVFYMMSEFYVSKLARGIRWNDPAVNIKWPIAEAMLSERDRNLPLLSSLTWKILLTGPTGFIGSNFVRQALARGHQIAGLALPGEALPPSLPGSENLHWLRGTLEEAPWREIEAFGADVCIHMAWITTPGIYLESPENFKLLESSQKFLKRLRELGTKHIIGFGTCVECQISGHPLSEDKSPLAPTTPYARCKNDLRLAMEEEAKTHGLKFCWVRVFYPYGPGEHPSRLCSSIIQKLSRDEKIVLKTPASTKDYIYIDDLAMALITVMESQATGIINLGTGIGVTVREIAQTLAGMMGKPHLISEIDSPETDSLGYVVADASRLRGLGWQPAYTMTQGLQRLMAAKA
jgi:dTDP-4-dehydrorhamnose 3,5-epimerase